MPRFFFHTADGGYHHDRDGIELPTITAARREAVRFTGAVMADQPDILSKSRDFRVQVTGEDGQLLFTVITLAVDTPALEGLFPES